MGESLAVRVTDAGGDVVDQLQRPVDLDGCFALDVRRQAPTGQVLLDDIRVSLLCPDIVDRNDPVVFEARGAVGLAQKAVMDRSGGGEMAAEQLDRHGTPLGTIRRSKDLRDTPAADPFL